MEEMNHQYLHLRPRYYHRGRRDGGHSRDDHDQHHLMLRLLRLLLPLIFSNILENIYIYEFFIIKLNTLILLVN